MSEEQNKNLEDSGFDCDHCGGRILVSRAVTPGRPVHGYYVCQSCGCEWTLKGDVLHIGTGYDCQASQRKRMGGDGLQFPDMKEMSVWQRVALIGGGIVLLLILIRFGGFMMLRFLFPLLIVVVLIYLVIKLGREQEWW